MKTKKKKMRERNQRGKNQSQFKKKEATFGSAKKSQGGGKWGVQGLESRLECNHPISGSGPSE